MTALYFRVAWRSGDGSERAALTLAIDAGNGGARVSQLTDVARATERLSGERLRIHTPLSPAAGELVRPLGDYLWADGQLNDARLRRHLLAFGRSGRLHAYRPRTVVAAGADLVGREQLIEDLERLLVSESVHLRGPRRYGKTSVLRRLAERNASHLRIDLGEETKAGGILAALLRAARIHAPSFDALKNSAARPDWAVVEAGGADLHGWLNGLRGREPRILGEILAALADANVILSIDEFSIYLRNLVRNGQPVAELLRAFAEARRRPERPLRCIVAGSAGLTAYARFHNLHAELEGLRPVDVAPLPPDAASILVEELLYGAALRPDRAAIERFLQHVGRPVPYFVHALAIELADSVGSGAVDAGAVDRAYQERMLSAGGEYFKPFRVEDRPYPDELRRAAHVILTHLAQSDRPVEEAELQQHAGLDASKLAELLPCLQEDFDLQSDGGWSMGCKVLADRFRRGTGYRG